MADYSLSNMLAQLVDISSTIKQSLLPQQCLLCAGASGAHAFCAACCADLPWHDAPACPVCALPAPGGQVCGACLQQPPAFDATVTVLDYAFPVDALLQRYKYDGLITMAEPLAELLLTGLGGRPLPDAVIPMPLHPQRLRERGYNQALEIARVVACRLDVTLATRACSRTRHTPPQAGLTLEQRRRNMRGVFACQADLRGRHIALLDDVMTSGASLDALARAVKAAGAAHVECWAVARTPRT